ncbi:diacylglycerol/lipid kinase family protein [Streptomyces mirabilis]|uniref:diacylglycerol/lipid kinase family protein n=1 Tax=Streptomyces TaxID=1883 RepID=UPI000BDDCBD8|nr:diacylglycerol kinase family protein [Streptomyces sp. OK228]SOE33681.1 Diacylglycerol kinase family enzyme [Streptomyces sp. OK228]
MADGAVSSERGNGSCVGARDCDGRQADQSGLSVLAVTENAFRPVTAARRPYLIVNPRSGGGKASRFRIADKARALGAQVLLLDPSRPQDLATVTRRAVDDGADLLGVAGGDGTQALVAEVAAKSGLPFVVIPAGTRNHFAMDLGLDREDPSAALEALTDGVELCVDLGFAGERVFVNNVSFGAYAALVQDPAYREDKIGTVVRILPEFLARHEGPELVVRAGLLTVDRPDAVLVSNNPYRADDPAGLGRRAQLDSGLLGVLAARAETPARLRSGQTHGLTQGLTNLATSEEVVVDADVPVVPVGLDGEAVTLPTPVRCWISPRMLRVRVPRHRPSAAPAERPPGWGTIRRVASAVERTVHDRHTG